MWKQPKFITYETMRLVTKGEDQIVVPCGFRKDGGLRKIKQTCLISRMRSLCKIKGTQPKIAACITMYNEDESLFKLTLQGILQNYNAMYSDEDLNLRQHDMIVVCVCDGFEKIPESFKKYAEKYKFLDEQLLRDKGYMEKDRSGNWKMKTMQDLMNKDVPSADIPKNILHLF